MKIKRPISFLIIFVVYIAATMLGIAAYRYLLYDFGHMTSVFVADIIATVFVFIFSVIFNNASVYDPYWSVAPPVIMLGLIASVGVSVPSVILTVTIFIWAIRLTANWAYTFHGLEHQDWRYTSLKEKTGRLYPFVNFFGIHTVPTVVVFLAMMPAIEVCLSASDFKPLSIIGAVISLLGALLELVADIQMQAYRKNRTTPFIEVGIWKYSRHPNYFGEILMWWGVSIFALFTLNFSFTLLIGAIANTLLFLFISIPLAEGRQSKKAGFNEYKSRTRMLLPIKLLKKE